MDRRKDCFHELIQDKSMRILELGPLDRPIAEKTIYPNTIYCDIRSTEEVQALYSGNDYLAATGIKIDIETIVPIDHVIKGSYAESFANEEKFDCIIASHVLEHMDDLIFSLRDIAQILKSGGIFCIIYPDKRYCFDHFRTSASFRDAYHVFRQGTKNNAPMVLDFYYSVIPENDPRVFWNQNGLLNELPRAPYENAVAHYKQALDGKRMDDVHYWPFTDMDFLKFLYDCTRAGLLPFHCVSFWPCVQNEQQFMLALQLDQTVTMNPERALKGLRQWMANALPDFYSEKDIRLKIEKESLVTQAIQLKEQIRQMTEQQKLLETQVIQLKEQIKFQKELNKTIQSELERQTIEYQTKFQQLERVIAEKAEDIQIKIIRIKELETIENSRTWRFTKPIRWLLDKLKGR